MFQAEGREEEGCVATDAKKLELCRKNGQQKRHRNRCL